MIESLRNIHDNASVAVLGSGPTLGLFSGNEDIAIACNGAANIEIAFDYFMCADWESHQRPWFKQSVKFDAVRIVEGFVAPHDDILYPQHRTREILIKQRVAQQMFSPPTIEPVKPHRWYAYYPITIENIELFPKLEDFQYVLKGASIVGDALQMAYLMGAREIHLYGCPMENRTGKDYFIKDGSFGDIRPYYAPNMDRLIEYIMLHGVQVFVHGNSRITKGIQVDMEFSSI